MLRNTLSALIISGIFFFFSCGNLINDELSGDDPNPPVVDPPIPPDVVSFGTVIGNNFSAAGRVRIQSSSGSGYFISGTIIGDSGSDEIWLSFIDKNANRKWSAILENAGTNDRISRIEVIDKDNILIFADRIYTGSDPLTVPKADLIMIKVNSISGIAWQKCLGDSQKNIVNGTVLTDDGGFLSIGITVIEGPPVEYRPFVIKVNSDGNIVWKKDYKIYFNKKNTKYFEIVRPAEIISLGDDKYLFAGVALIPANEKLAGFYCIIDGSNTGEGKLIKSGFKKAGNKTIAMIGNVNYSDSLVSVISIADSADSSVKYSILSMDKDTLKVSSKKSYKFDSLRVQSGLINNKPDEFMLAGMIKPAAGKGIYTITFDKSGSIKEEYKKYYNNIENDFISVEFNKMYQNSDLAYIIRLNNPGDSKDLFIDRCTNSDISEKSISEAEVVVEVPGDEDLEENDNDADVLDSPITENSNPGLIFYKY